jgi:hypothetical protein
MFATATGHPSLGRQYPVAEIPSREAALLSRNAAINRAQSACLRIENGFRFQRAATTAALPEKGYVGEQIVIS